MVSIGVAPRSIAKDPVAPSKSRAFVSPNWKSSSASYGACRCFGRRANPVLLLRVAHPDRPDLAERVGVNAHGHEHLGSPLLPRHVPVIRAVTRELCSDPRHLPPDARDPDPNPRGPVPFGAVAGKVDPRVVAPVIRLDVALGEMLAVPDELFVPGDCVHTGVHFFDRRLSGSCE